MSHVCDQVRRVGSWFVRLGFLLAGILVLFIGMAQARCTGKSILPKLEETYPRIMLEVHSGAGRILNARAILWRIEKAGIAPSHLFGTMHVTDVRVIAMPRSAREAARNARVVALEIADMSADAVTTIARRKPQLMVYTDGSRLDRKLSRKEFEQVSALLARSGFPAEMAPVVRPWLVGMMLALPDCEHKRVQQGVRVLDQVIADRARENKIPVVGLETVETQLAAITSISEADQVALLRVSLAFLAEREDLFETLIRSYTKRELGVIHELSKGLAKIAGLSSSGFAGFSRELLVKRNHTMFTASRPLVDKGSAFIAVGFGHLIGARGLVAMYREAGFTVTAVE